MEMINNISYLTNQSFDSSFHDWQFHCSCDVDYYFHSSAKVTVGTFFNVSCMTQLQFLTKGPVGSKNL